MLGRVYMSIYAGMALYHSQRVQTILKTGPRYRHQSMHEIISLLHYNISMYVVRHQALHSYFLSSHSAHILTAQAVFMHYA